MTARYYVQAPNQMWPVRTLWRINNERPDFDDDVMQEPDAQYKGATAERLREWFSDVVESLRANGLCELQDREGEG